MTNCQYRHFRRADARALIGSTMASSIPPDYCSKYISVDFLRVTNLLFILFHPSEVSQSVFQVLKARRRHVAIHIHIGFYDHVHAIQLCVEFNLVTSFLIHVSLYSLLVH